jgi:phosphatidylglycerophosphate synthase
VPSNLNPANAMTASRFLCLPWFVWSLEQGHIQMATLALIVCGLLDVFDGLVARLLRCQTHFGAVFDAVTDAICYGVMMVLLPVYDLVSWVPVAIILGYGALTFVERAIFARRAKRTLNYRSYAMEKMAAYAAYLIGCGLAQFQVNLVFWAYVVLVTIIFIHDSKRLLLDPVDAERSAAECWSRRRRTRSW